MKEYFTLEITQEHIYHANELRDHKDNTVTNMCPFALALQEKFNDPTIKFGYWTFSVGEKSYHTINTHDWIHTWDMGGLVEPRSFDFESEN